MRSKNIDFILKMCNNKSMKKIAILGGTFNPVHTEHVQLAKCAIDELKLDKLIVMPTYISPHKNTAPESAEDRLNMLKIAFSGYDKIEVSDFEINNQGKSYTYLTVEHFKQTENAELYFIVGGDMLTNFKTWRYPERILASCNLAVFSREDFATDFDAEKDYFEKTFNKTFTHLSYKGKGASSTKIRVYNQFGLKSEYLPNGVYEYIQKNNLYAPDKYQQFISKNLPEKRVVHTANVVVCAMQRAKELGLDEQKVVLACTLHDCAKYLDYKTVKGFTLPEGVPQPVVHAFLGAYVAKEYLGVTDEEVIDAIRYHTSGKAEMTTLSKLVFVADMLEEGRNYDGVEKLRELYRTSDFEKCFIECLKEEFIHLLNKKQYIYQQTVNAFNYYVK